MADLPLSVWMTRVECADFFGENLSAGSKARSAATLSPLFLDAGRLAQGAGSFSHYVTRSRSWSRPRAITKGTILALPRGALALFGGNQDRLKAGVARN